MTNAAEYESAMRARLKEVQPILEQEGEYWLRWSAKKYGIPLTLDDSKAKGIKTHAWLVQHGYSNTNHTDPWGYLAKLGITKARFQKDLKRGFSGANIALTK